LFFKSKKAILLSPISLSSVISSFPIFATRSLLGAFLKIKFGLALELFEQDRKTVDIKASATATVTKNTLFLKMYLTGHLQ